MIGQTACRRDRLAAVIEYLLRYLWEENMAALNKPRVADQRRTSLKKWGTSQAVRVPKVVCDATGIGTGSDLIMESGTDDAGPFILLRPVSAGHRSFADAPYVSMEELFEGYEGGYAPHEANWGPDVGAEVVS